MRTMRRALAAALEFPREGAARTFGKSDSNGRPTPQAWWRSVVQAMVVSSHAPFLTHGCLVVLFAIEFTLILVAPFPLMLIPCILIHHRIGILLHEYMHGIPFHRYRDNLRLLTIANSLLLTFGFQEVFRGTHLEHHRWLNTERDPGYWPPPTGGPKSIFLRPFWILYRSVAGDHGASRYVRHLAYAQKGCHPYVKPARVAAEALLSTFFLVCWVAMGAYRLPLALVALHFCVWPPAAFRGTLEHSSNRGDDNFANEYRVRIPLFNMNRHIHHHMDPMCPWYKLEFKTQKPRPPHVYWTHWYHVFLKRDYVFMQPMPSSVRLRRPGCPNGKECE